MGDCFASAERDTKQPKKRRCPVNAVAYSEV